MNNFAKLPEGKHKLFFTVDDLKKLRDAKILSKTTAVELIQGEIFHRLELIPDEFAKAEKLQKILENSFKDKAIIKVFPSIRLYDIQCVKPSIAVCKPSIKPAENDFFISEDTFFVIELTDTKFNYADNARSRYYGMFKYPEVWFVNNDLGIIEVCTQPNLGYSRCRTYLRHDICQSETEPDLQIKASEVLG
ncbi:MAG TPA: hypothetical protein PKY59_16455 [Pyrinomonadaceae bacterium]|nr:hypothetical protein [Pyrinomonadaceae bacterium]